MFSHSPSSRYKRVTQFAKLQGSAASAASSSSWCRQPSWRRSSSVVTTGIPKDAASYTLYGAPAANRVGATKTRWEPYRPSVAEIGPTKVILAWSRKRSSVTSFPRYPAMVNRVSDPNSSSINGSTSSMNQQRLSKLGLAKVWIAPTNRIPDRVSNRRGVSATSRMLPITDTYGETSRRSSAASASLTATIC